MLLELQKRIFEYEPARRDLLGYTPTSPKKYRVQVFRNHSFELVEHTIGLFLDYAGLGIEFLYSSYDDSFSFLGLEPGVDLVLLWIDTTRYSGDIPQFLNERLFQLRQNYTKPVLIVPFGTDVSLAQAGVTVVNLSALESELGAAFTDRRAIAVAGTPLSGKAMLAISRLLGLQYFPALLRPALKAVVVDLDHTLYQGVIGEDGVQGVILTEGHKRLQTRLKQLAACGFFLCAASKNNPEDVEELFCARTDFPLKKEDFTKIIASWDSKADSIQKILQFLNINADSAVFMDDNTGELMTVQAAFPEIKLIHAGESGDATCAVLNEFPGLLKLAGSEDDEKRRTDVQANEARHALRKKLSPEEYIRSLNIHLKFSVDNASQVKRISELANKTNQFIFNYRRYTEAEIETRMQLEEYAVVAVSLSDRLSDSGLIGICVGRSLKDYVEIEECLISCRALGRGIESVIVLGAINQLVRRFGKAKVKVLFQRGARNTPAQQFIEEYLSNYLREPGKFSFDLPENLLTVETNE